MKVTKTLSADVVVGFQCDICQKFIRHHQEVTDGCYDYYMTLRGDFGYGSPMDMEEHVCYICESCYSKVREFIEVVLGGKVQVIEHSFSVGGGPGEESIKLEDLEKDKC